LNLRLGSIPLRRRIPQEGNDIPKRQGVDLRGCPVSAVREFGPDHLERLLRRVGPAFLQPWGTGEQIRKFLDCIQLCAVFVIENGDLQVPLWTFERRLLLHGPRVAFA
jgi:hypothetical protein